MIIVIFQILFSRMIYPRRKQIRLKGYDYSKSGFYFITINIKGNNRYFGEIVNHKMILNNHGKIAEDQWKWLGVQFPYINIREFVVMPDHFHGILQINAGDGRDRPVQSLMKIKPVPELIGAFKMLVSKNIRNSGFGEFEWHRSYHDHIIRNEEEYKRIAKYITENPENWKK